MRKLHLLAVVMAVMVVLSTFTGGGPRSGHSIRIGFVTGNAGWKPTNQDYASLFLTNFSGPMEVYKCLNGEQPWNSPNIQYVTVY